MTQELKAKYLRKTKKILLKMVSYIFLFLFSFVFLFPFFYMFFRSLMTNAEINSLPVPFFPKSMQWENYAKALAPEYIGYLKNTMIIVLFNIVVVPLSSSFAAFGFARCEFRGREAVFFAMLATMMIPGVVLQVPLYMIFNSFGMLNTLMPLTLPNFLGGGAMNVFLVRQFMKTIPKEIDNAARIDGANPFLIYLKICLPLCAPVLILIAVTVFIGNFNDFSAPLIYIKRPEKYPLALGVYYKFSGGDMTVSTVNLQMALSVLMTIPLTILFFIFQKQIINGVQIGGGIKA